MPGTASASSTPSRRASRSGPVPSTLTIAVGPRALVAPRGSPQIARTCCSNWEVAAPSIVQWPLLWTRGASSLTTSVPSRSRNSSTVSVPTRSIAAARLSAIAVASRRAAAGRSAGATDSTRIPASWRLRAGGKMAGFPSMPRATITDSSTSKSSSRSASNGPPSGWPTRPIADSMSAAPATRTWPRPSYPPVGALTRSGVPRSAAAAARASVVATARHGATAIPARSTNRRSARRSCVMRSGSSPGRTGARSRAARTTSGPMCSSSYVTTSAWSARSSAASTSS